MNNYSSGLNRAWLALFIFIFAAAVFLLFRPDQTQVVYSSPVSIQPQAQGYVLRVGAPEPVRQATVISPYGPGFEFELVTGFCRIFFFTPEWVAVSDKDTGFAMLQRDEIDVLVGFWGDGPSIDPGTEQAVEQVADKNATPVEEAPTPGDNPLPPRKIAVGKAYAHFNPVRVTGADMPEEEEDPGAEESRPLPVFSQPPGSEDRNDALLLDPASFSLWRPFMGKVSTRRTGKPIPFRWFWRDDGSPVASGLAEFWQSPDRKVELEELTERYFGFIPKNIRHQDILELSETLTSKLACYDEFIRKAADETGVPTLLLVAAIYQESRFDPGAVSETRVRGIMQLTTATAKMLNVDREDPEQCIMGGARYLRELYDKVGDKAATDWDRWFMALGAYNQGLSNLNRSIRIARELGSKGDTWADVKRAFPLNTACRGREARGFVERIRYYNFILHGLVALAPTEAEDLAPLLGLALADNQL